MSIEVLKPGSLTTIQDLGRTGYQRLGVPVGGAMDEDSHRLANCLVGNPESEATLEITLVGPSLRFTRSALIAIAGADLSPRMGEPALPCRTAVLVRAGGELHFGQRRSGVRAYLAVRGGFAVPRVMGSKSTYLRGGFGGFEGRALRKGDVLPLAAGAAEPWPAGLAARLRASSAAFVALDPPPGIAAAPPAGCPTTVRVVAGEQWEAFSPQAQLAFQEAEFRLSPQSDRMGFRFEGPALELKQPLEMISEAVAFGTVQVPPDGKPIVLMADRQTTGGYPKIASVASVDLPLLAQVMPGQGVRYRMIRLEEAQQRYLARERQFAEFARRANVLERE